MLKIIVACHRECQLPEDEIYIPVQAGKSCADIDLGIQGDNELRGAICDNISDMNGIYCEMTAMYWAWKNIRDLYPEITHVGLCHYRRYFAHSQKKIRNTLIKLNGTVCDYIKRICPGWVRERLFGRPDFTMRDFCIHLESVKDRRLSTHAEKLKEKALSYDIVTTTAVRLYRWTVKRIMSEIVEANNPYQHKDDIALIEDIVKNDYPEFYPQLIATLNGRETHAGNMLIINVNLLDEYCSFIFGVLEQYIKHMSEIRSICDARKEDYFLREGGFFSELLTHVFVEHAKSQGYRIAEVDRFFINSGTR